MVLDPAAAQLLTVVAGMFFAWVATLTVKGGRNKARKEMKIENFESNRGENIFLYPDATRSAIATAERVRKQALESQQLKQREQSLRVFQAYQECPKCQKSGFYLISDIPSPWDITRECGECGHQWTQAK